MSVKCRVGSIVRVTLTALMFILCSVPVMAEGGPDIERRDEYAGRFLANYATTIYNMEYNNFPSNEANAVLQTSDGYMWFGGYNGLYRYDGKSFTIWDAITPGGFGSSNIRALYEGGDGTLWIGTNDKGLVKYSNGVFTIYDKSFGLPSNTIRAISGQKHDDGWKVVCGTPEGLFELIISSCEERINKIPIDTQVHQAVVALCLDDDSNMYAVLNSGEMFAINSGGETVHFPHASPFYTIGAVSGGRMVAGTRDGEVFILQFDGKYFTRSDLIFTPLNNIDVVYEDSNGYIWLPAENGIGYLDADEQYRNVGNPSGVGFYSGICEDYQNGYWITGTRGGIVKLSVSAFTNVSEIMNVETGTVNAVVLHGGNMYIGTNERLIILDSQGKPVHTEFSGMFQTRVRGIFADSKDNIWICTYSDLGVVRYTPSTGAYRNWTVEEGLVTERTRLIKELPNGVIAVGSASGVNFIKGDDVITAGEAFESDTFIELPDIMVLSMVCSDDGTLYLGTDGAGVYVINKDGTTHYQEEDGLTGGVVLRMRLNTKSGGVWVGASPGLCYIDNDGVISVIEEMPPHTFLDILQYKDDLLLLTSGAILRTNADALLDPDAPFEFSSVSKSAGLGASINANSWNLVTDDGRLYFCTDRGVNIYSIEREYSPFIPYAGIARINVDGTDYAARSETIILPREAYRLTVELSHLSFGLLDDAVLRYMLVGQDAHPITLFKGDNMEISYTNLGGGDYTLRVWTENGAGEIGNFIEIDMTKELKFFERSFVWVFLALLFAALTVLAAAATIRYRTRKHERKQREYRTIISQALSAIANAIDAKDSYTSGHSVRVAAYSIEIARKMGLDKAFVENLYYIALLHDVGKIGIPNEIINKPSALTDEEYAIMKQHPGIGKEILKEITTIHNLTSGTAEHHERWDGKGYQRGISGDEISMEARIIAAADTYDAMSSDRSYRKALPKEVILKEFKRCIGNQFDIEIANVVIGLIEQDHFSIIDINGIIDLNSEIHVRSAV